MRYTDVEIHYDASDKSITDDTVVMDLDYTSDDEGEFTTNPSIDITFASSHDLVGFTLNFDGDVDCEFNVTWYTPSAATKSFATRYKNFVIYQTVRNCSRIHIEFTKAIPNSEIAVKSLKYGIFIIWDSDMVQNSTLVLETNRIAEMLSTNTLTFDIVDVDELTNPGNKEGLHKYLQKRVPIYAYEIVDDVPIKLGDFCLDSFNYEKNICHMTAVSYISVFDTIMYDNGDIYNGTAAGVVLMDIFSKMGLSSAVTIDSDTSTTPLYGTIKPCTCKEALQQVLFACHSIINLSDMSQISIHKSTTGVFGELAREEKFHTKVIENDYVSGVKISYTHYSVSSESENVINDIYNDGVHRIVFDTPYTNYSIVGATLDASGKFFVEFTVSGTQQVIVTANPYNSFDNSVQVNNLDANEDESVREFSTTLCNITTARALARKLLRFFESRFEIEVKCLATDISMDKRLEIQNPTQDFDNYIGIVTSRTIDLTGGFIDTAKYIGYFDTSSTVLYMTGEEDEELIADNSAII